MKLLVFLVLLSSSFNGLMADDYPCAARWEEDGQGYVCVCNSTYCDTVERPQKLTNGEFYMYKTSNSTPGFTRTTGSFVRSAINTETDILFTINPSIEYQEILGFGAAVTDSSAININSLPQEAQAKLMESYFGPNGIEYSVLRVPIGGTDFSTRDYTLDDGGIDTDLKNFSLAQEDYNLKIPLIKKANNVSGKTMTLSACPWGTPDWMGASSGTTYLIKDLEAVWAMYYIKFLEGFRAQGVEFWSVSAMNEGIMMLDTAAVAIPDSMAATESGGSATIVSLAHAQREWFVNNLKPLLVSHNFTDVKI